MKEVTTITEADLLPSEDYYIFWDMYYIGKQKPYSQKTLFPDCTHWK